MEQNCSKLPGNGILGTDSLSARNYSFQPGNEKPGMAMEPGNGCPGTASGNGFVKKSTTCFYYQKTRERTREWKNAILAPMAGLAFPGPFPVWPFPGTVPRTVGSGSQFTVPSPKTHSRVYIGSGSQFTVPGLTSLYKREYTHIHGDTLLHFEKKHSNSKGGKIW